MRKALALIAMVLGMVVAVPNQASAITYGDLVTDPVSQAPWVVSIWSSPTIDGDKKYICTGTLVDPRVVVTAANCLNEHRHLKMKHLLLQQPTGWHFRALILNPRPAILR